MDKKQKLFRIIELTIEQFRRCSNHFLGLKLNYYEYRRTLLCNSTKNNWIYNNSRFRSVKYGIKVLNKLEKLKPLVDNCIKIEIKVKIRLVTIGNWFFFIDMFNVPF